MAPIRSQATQSVLASCVEQTTYEDGVLETRYFCDICNGSVARKADFYRHMRKHTGKGLFYCKDPSCTHVDGFTQKSNLEQHVRSVHRRERYSCVHFWVDAQDNKFKCTEDFSDPSGLIRHRSLRHGFEAGDDESKVTVPTLVGTEFPNSKYARRNKRKANDDDAGDEVAKPRARRQKRAKATPAGPSSAPKPRTKKSKPTTSAPKLEQQIDWNSMFTFPTSQSPTPSPSPVSVSEWQLGFDSLANNQLSMQPQPAGGMNTAEPLVLPYLSLPAQTDDFDALFGSELQTTTAAMNNWSLCPQPTEFNFSFSASALLPPAGCDGTIDPRMLAVPASITSVTPEQGSLANAGYAAAPGYFDPAQGMAMSWSESYPSACSSRESTASPVLDVSSVLASIVLDPLWVPAPPSEPDYGGLFGMCS